MWLVSTAAVKIAIFHETWQMLSCFLSFFVCRRLFVSNFVPQWSIRNASNGLTL